MKAIAFQEKNYSYNGQTFVIKIFRTTTGWEVKSYWNEDEFPKGSIQMSVQVEEALRGSGLFESVFEKADHLEAFIKIAEENVKILYDHRHLF